ncbi:Wzy polymerase domain-containing protein [Vitreoscilla massiliensis]|uniref:Wzy polymerase domain-containing protein n=1 Tax=Vitreoscilla massiliensis TaxID=1689272 RepID=A0ABY4E297_9NEIS|nr:Wzy polymerase domain-containing protein [Vitreoscilla massiliensis]UOO89905.1 Wzy polymerase domain-containing protein [Vitreoscilla massiliensis]
MNNVFAFYRKSLGQALAVAALMCLMSVPFLMNVRVGPQGGFIIESTSTILALCMVLGVTLMGKFTHKPPVISVMFAVFAALIALQARLMDISWVSQVDLTAVVLLVVALSTWALASWQQESETPLLRWIALGLLMGVLLQTLVMWMQYLGLTKQFHGLVSYSATENIMGQLGQRNHLGHYLMWGMVSILYLSHTKVLPRVLPFLLVVWLGICMGLISSRTLIVYLIAISLLAIVWRMWAGREYQSLLLKILGTLFWVFTAQYGLKKALSVFLHSETNTGLDRLVNSVHVVDTARSVEWHKAWLSFLNSPWTGHGWGSSSSQSVLLHGALPDLSGLRTVGVLFTHCHNSLLQLLSEVGLLGTLWLAGGFLVLVWACFKYAKRPESFFILALATITVCHSLLEYPLWYVYFLLPFALFWALVPRTAVHTLREHSGCPRLNLAASVLTVVALAMVIRLLFAYNAIMAVYGVAKNETPAIAAEKKAKIHALIEHEYLLNYYARMALIERSFDAYQGTEVADEVENARLVAEYRPYNSYAIRWGMYQYRSGQEAAAKKWLEEIWLYYPASIAGNVNAMQKSLWYTDLVPVAKQRCLQYQQKVKITCP